MSRKRMLVEHGFRLPSAIDNRPLTWDEFGERIGQTIYLSATPGPYELQRVGGDVVEQVIRPTGLIDPEVHHQADQGPDRRPGARDQAADRARRAGPGHHADQEDVRGPHRLPARELGIRARYLHSEVDTLRRVELLRELRLGEYDVLVGINLLREGLDLPEVSLVAILDADKEGFLRSRDVADPDHRPGGAERLRPGAHVRRQGHPVDAAGDRRDQPAAREAGRLQHRAAASTRSRCASGSPTSWTRSSARTPTPSSCSAAAGGSSPAARRRSPGCRPGPGAAAQGAAERAPGAAAARPAATWSR